MFLIVMDCLMSIFPDELSIRLLLVLPILCIVKLPTPVDLCSITVLEPERAII